MTTRPFIESSPWPRSLWICSLIVASIGLTPAFHCGFPLVAYAAIAASTLDRRDALLASGGVWLATQVAVIASLHHHVSPVTLAWGLAMGVAALLSCETAIAVSRRVSGLVGACVAFAASFVVYKGVIFGFAVAMGSSAGRLDSLLATFPRTFLVSACVFAGLGVLSALGSVACRKSDAIGLAPRHA